MEIFKNRDVSKTLIKLYQEKWEKRTSLDLLPRDWEEIAKALNSDWSLQLTAADVYAKMSRLRVSFDKELQSMKRSKAAGGNYKPTWWAFPLLSFWLTESNVNPGTALVSNSGENSEADEHETGPSDEAEETLNEETAAGTSAKRNSTPAKKREASSVRNTDETAKKSRSEPETLSNTCADDLESFGRMIVDDLRQIKSKQLKRKAKRKILQTVQEIQEEDDRLSDRT